MTDEDKKAIEALHQNQKDVAIFASRQPLPEMTGRGIVTSIYDAEFASGWVLLSELVRLGVRLPIEVFYRPGELQDWQLAALRTLPLDMSLRVLQANVGGFQVKPFAILESSFEEVLWIDADNVPLRDPACLFEDPEYIEKGSLFWRDVSGADRAKFWHPESFVWTVFNVPHNDSEEFDTGQLLINKKRCWVELALTTHVNGLADFYYRFVHGDKDTFRLCWWSIFLMRGNGLRQINTLEDPKHVPYGFMPYGPFHIGRPNPWRKWGGGSVMVQRDRRGEPLFNHRTINKWRIDYDAAEEFDTPQDGIYRKHLDALRALR